ncbi:MAG: protein kinase, partial [Polyangiaceae bacterium]
MTLGAEKSEPSKMPKFCPACRERFPSDALFCPNDGAPLISAPKADPSADDAGPDPYVSREISGHIEIRSLAGVGAMGRVYRAFQKGIDRDVAVKILHRELSANTQLVSRFHREAKVASRLQHPNVVHVHLAGQLPDGALYIVMEYLDGMSLQSALNAAGGGMDLPRALHIILQLCDAVGEAHAQGIVHRDLKPENVMLVKRGQDTDYVKVLDFGIARLSWGEQSMATAAGLIFGTARYISPEGAQGEGVGPAGDVYAIATLLYQMLAGRTPFEGDQAVALLIQQIHDAPTPLLSIPRGAYVPAPVAAVIMQNLAKAPHDRAPDARAFARSILEAARLSGISADDYAPPAMRLSGAMKLAPLQQTRQMQLSPEMQERLSPAPSPSESAPSMPGGAASPPANDDRARMMPGAPTAKWTPSPELQVKLAEAGQFPPPRSDDSGRAASSRPSNVDQTMDDDDAPPAPQPSVPSFAQTAPMSHPHPRVAALVPSETPPIALSRPPIASAGPVGPSSPPDEPQRTRTEISEPLPISIHHQQPSYPPSGGAPPGYGPTPQPPNITEPPARSLHTPTPLQPFDTTVDEPSPGRWFRFAAIIILLFLAGGGIAAAALYKLGYMDTTAAQTAKIDDQVAKATDAMSHERWDSPPGDNVKDLTDAALVRWPHEPRIVQLRSRASAELVKKAVGLRLGGNLTEALHFIGLAGELDPTDETTQKLAERWAAAAKDAGTLAQLDGGIAPLQTSHPQQTPHPQQQALPGMPRATLEATPTKPKLGQSVEFTAKTTAASGGAPKSVEDAAFILAGPGIG